MRGRLLLLAAQTVLLGLSAAFLVVPASALFLHRFGADDLPYTYLAAAASGVAVSSLLRRAQQRVSLGVLTAVVLALACAGVTVAWLLLEFAGWAWVTYPLVVAFPVLIPVGFVLVGGQAGRLLDVRELKAHFPRVVAGFSIGFGGGALLAAWLVHRIGGPVALLLLDAGAATVWLIVSVATARRYADVLLVRPVPLPPAGRRSAAPAARGRSALSNPLVIAVLVYQVLSAMVTQLLDYMVWERAAARYPDPSDLARFQGVFGALINVVALVFVVGLAGRMLTRIGVAGSLATNPLGVLVVLGPAVALGFGDSVAGIAFFLSVCLSQVVDLTLTDGTTRTSVNATYQVLPVEARLVAQTRVEGAGVPLATGLVGVVLLAFDGLSLDVRSVAALTLVLTIAWVLASRIAGRRYVAGLREQFTHPEWSEEQQGSGDAATQVAAARLLHSADPRDVRVGLGAMAGAGEPALVQVAALVDDEEPRVRLRAAAILAAAGADPGGNALAQWRQALHSDTPAQVAAALEAAADHPAACFVPGLVEAAGRDPAPPGIDRALGAHARVLLPCLESASPELSDGVRDRIVRAVGRARLPGSRALLAAQLADPAPATRRAAARLLADTAGTSGPPSGLPPASQLLAVEARHAARALAALVVLPDRAQAAPLRRALDDELAATGAHAGVLLAVSADSRAVANAALSLSSGSGGDRGLALELLESSTDRATALIAITLIDPTLEPSTRRQRLERFQPGPADAATWLGDLVRDPEDHWCSEWLRACALYAAPAVPGTVAAELAAEWVDAEDAVVAETARWLLSRDYDDRHGAAPDPVPRP